MGKYFIINENFTMECIVFLLTNSTASNEIDLILNAKEFLLINGKLNQYYFENLCLLMDKYGENNA